MTAREPASLLRGKRFYIGLFLFFGYMINYIDRVNLAVAAPAIANTCARVSTVPSENWK